MRFRTLLIHRCSLLTEGQVIGQDDYGRDIIGKVEVTNVPCRFDRVIQRASTDDTGTDIISEHVMFFEALHGITFGTEIVDITDKEGNPILSGSFFVQNITPIYKRSTLHHYEVSVQKG